MTGNQISVLYVDDEVIFLEVIGDLLRECDFNVTTVDNGEQGIRNISENLPDILLLDLYMPGMSGLEVLTWVKNHHPDLPVIIISGISDLKNAMEAIRAGAWDYLVKPIQEIDVLLHAIDRCLERSRLIRQNKEYRENLEKLVEERTREMQRRGRILKSSLQEKEILLKEIHHRVKNNMAVMSSLLSLQANAVGDPKLESAFKESSARIRSMAMVHEKLYQSENLSSINFPLYIASLAKHLSSMYRRPDKHIDIRVEAEDIFLNIVKAVPCGLIINELLTNCLKYAFENITEGEVVIGFHDTDDGLVLSIIDDGVGLAEDINMKNPETLGLQLVDMLTRQLNGRLEWDREGGTAFYIYFPR